MAFGGKSGSLRLTFCRNLRDARRSLGLSQEELAAIAGLHRTYVGSIERGERNVSIDNIEILSAAVEQCASDLMTEGFRT